MLLSGDGILVKLVLGLLDDLRPKSRGEGKLQLFGADVAAIALMKFHVAVGVEQGLGLVLRFPLRYILISTVMTGVHVEVFNRLSAWSR